MRSCGALGVLFPAIMTVSVKREENPRWKEPNVVKTRYQTKLFHILHFLKKTIKGSAHTSPCKIVKG